MTASIFTPLARAQYAAVLRMRWHEQRNLLRTARGRFELVARIFSNTFFLAIGGMLALGFGTAAYQFAAARRLQLLPLLLWPVFAIWQLLPVMIASAQGDRQPGLLLRFPVSFASYTVLYLALGLFDLSSLMGGIALLGIGVGLTVAHPVLAPFAFFALLLFAVFNLLLTRTIFAWIERWLARRRTREILGMIFVAGFLGLQLLNPAFRHHRSSIRLAQIEQFAGWAGAAQRYLPPGIAAATITRAQAANYSAALKSLAESSAFVAAAALLLGIRLRAGFRGESLGEAPAIVLKSTLPNPGRQGGPQKKRWQDTRVGGVFVKELQYLFRSGVMLLGLFTPIFFILIFGRSVGSNSGISFQFAFPAAVAYSFLPLTRQVSNSLGAEHAGIQLLFLSPTPFRTVMLAKNLLQLAMFAVEFALAVTLSVLRFGTPSPVVLLATLCWLLFAVPMNLAVGNILSITMAYRMTLTRVTREQGSIGNGLLSLVAQLLIIAVGAAVYLPLAAYGHPAFAAPVCLTLALAAAAFWRGVFLRIDRLAASRRETLLAALVRPA